MDPYLYDKLGRIERKLERILLLLGDLQTQGKTMASDLTALTAQVKANTDLEASAVTLIQGLAAQIAALANDPVAIAALAQQLNTSASALAAAITANTPPAPPPGP